MVKLIRSDFDGYQMQFRDDGWFNATAAAQKFSKDAGDWLRQRDTIAYIVALAEFQGKSLSVPELNEINNLDSKSARSRELILRAVKKTGYVSTKTGSQENGGGTWLHPKLAVAFARWVSVDFAIWCDEQIDKIIRGDKSVIDWGMLRHATKSSNKVANQILQMVRSEQGKETAAHHYANEAKLVNYALTGKFESVNRDTLSPQDLDLLASLENRNSVLLGREVDRETRKEILCAMAAAHRTRLIK